MRLLDRYIVRSFLFNYLLAFGVMVGMYVLLDLIVNVNQFTKGSETGGGMGSMVGLAGDVVDYYSYQLLVIFQQVSAAIPLLAAGFTMVRMTRHNELTAMLASGVSLYRVAAPIVLCAIGFSLLVIVDQELLMPNCVEKLLRRHDEVRQTATAKRTDALYFVRDADGSLLTASVYNANARVVLVGRVTEQEVEKIGTLDEGGRVGRVETKMVGAVREVKGAWAGRALIDPGVGNVLVDEKTGEEVVLPGMEEREVTSGAENQRVKRWRGKVVEVTKDGVVDGETGRVKTVKLLKDVRIIKRDQAGAPKGRIMAAWGVWTSPDGANKLPTGAWHFWGTRQIDDATEGDPANRVAEVVGDQLYMTRLSPEQLDLVFSKKAVEFLSSGQISRLIEDAGSPEVNKLGLLKIMHIRFTQPIMNLIMLLIGIPFLLTREPGRLIVNMIYCTAVSAAVFVATFVLFQMAGSALNPVVGAWMPVLLFGPLAVAMLDVIKT